MVMDSRPFTDLRRVVASVPDDRVSVFAEWVGAGLKCAGGSCPAWLESTGFVSLVIHGMPSAGLEPS